MKTSKTLIFGIHGGGNIGLGCIADIVSRSPYPYQIVATSRDKFLTEIINHRNCFWLCKVNGKHKALSTCIKNISIIDPRNPAMLAELYTAANLLALCLTEKAVREHATDIAHGLLARYKNQATKLKILVLMNKPQCEQFVKEKVYRAMIVLTGRKLLAERALRIADFIPTVVDRIVNRIEKKTIIKQLNNQLANEDDHLIESKHNLLPLIKKINQPLALFNSEKNFSLYVDERFTEASQFPDIQKVSNIDQFAEIKNKFINGPHAMLAWIGGLMGCQTIAEAISIPSMRWFLNTLMDQEIAPILKAEYPVIKNHELSDLKTNFIGRCINSIEDHILRVGRDPLRKLKSGGRVRGILELKQKHHLNIATPELEHGMAAGILYAVREVDPLNEECQIMRDIYNKGSYQAILCYKGKYGDESYPGFDRTKDQALIGKILRRIAVFEKVCKIN